MLHTGDADGWHGLRVAGRAATSEERSKAESEAEAAAEALRLKGDDVDLNHLDKVAAQRHLEAKAREAAAPEVKVAAAAAAVA
jgi:hypothetical protein